MDEYQRRKEVYYDLDTAARFLHDHGPEAEHNTHVMELFATWILAKFLEQLHGRKCVIGFLLFDIDAQPQLQDLMSGNLIPQDVEVDSFLVELPDGFQFPQDVEVDSFLVELPDGFQLSEALPQPQIKLPLHCQIQVKRYVSEKPVSAGELMRYVAEKVHRYGDSPELNVVFWIKAHVSLDTSAIRTFVQGANFKVGGVFLAGTIPLEGRNEPFVMELHPNFTGRPLMFPKVAESWNQPSA